MVKNVDGIQNRSHSEGSLWSVRGGRGLSFRQIPGDANVEIMHGKEDKS